MRGIGTYVRGLAARLLEQDEVPIEFWGWAGDQPFQVRSPHHAVWLPRGPVPRTKYPSLLRLAMRARSRLSAAPVVHITDPSALVSRLGRPVMTTVYDLIPLHEPIAAQRNAYADYLGRLRSADLLFAISQATATDIAAELRVPESKIRLARPGVRIPGVGDLPPPIVDGSFFLYIGSPDPHKNLKVLLEAMKLAPDLKEMLVMAGSWPEGELDRLLSSVRADRTLRAKVRHVGFVSDDQLLSLLRACTALVIPSLFEGFGLPVAEALAAGAAVIHSRLSVLDEVSAGSALTFNATSAGELSACLTTLAHDEELRRELRERGRKRAESITWDAALSTTLEAYRELLSRVRVSESG